MKKTKPDFLLDLVEAAKASKKYRDLDLPTDFLYDLAEQAARSTRSASTAKSSFRASLHNVIAPYLEVIDYVSETSRLGNSPEVLENLQEYCLEMMQKHASTRERVPFLVEFCEAIHAEIGAPSSVLDLACALDPLCLPWIHLGEKPNFLAYDVNGARVAFLNQFFHLSFPFAQAVQKDIFVHTPEQRADCAFFFKEAHRLEKRQAGATAKLIEKLNVEVIVLSLPAVDLAGHHSLESFHTDLVVRSLSAEMSLKTVRVGNELLFFIRKEAAQ